jgi:hypothetical protein
MSAKYSQSIARFTALIWCMAVAFAQSPVKSTNSVPRLIKISGVAVDATGKPISGTLGMTFTLYASQEGGVPIWTENQNVEADTNGRYTVLLGSTQNEGIPAEVFAGSQRWLGVQVQGEAEGPRVLMTSVPYSLKSADAETLGGLPASAFALAGSVNSGLVGEPTAGTGQPRTSLYPTVKTRGGESVSGGGSVDYIPVWTGSASIANSNIFETTAGNVGVGTTAPAATLEAVSGVSSGVGLMGFASAATGSNAGVSGVSASSSGIGVFGQATATNGGAYGVFGTTSSANGVAVYGNGVNGVGILGATVNPTPGYSGVAGYATATTGGADGVYGSTTSPSGSGVFGNAAAPTGTNFGVFGQAVSPNGIGVDGSATQGTGVAGVSAGSAGYGVYGSSTATSGSGRGVYGDSLSPSGIGVSANASGGGTALVATATGSGTAGVFNGNVEITGNLAVSGTVSKSGGSFRIDHPLDPEHKYLYHSFVESPDMMNIYNGIVTLSRHGDALIELPDWFEALNRDFRYQLTCIGAFAPVYIASGVSGNRFRIAGGRAGMKVSWQVTGIRQDVFANKHRIPVEEDKQATPQ